MAGRKTIRIVVTGKQRPETSVDDMTRLVLALGRELAKRSPEESSPPAREEAAG